MRSAIKSGLIVLGAASVLAAATTVAVAQDQRRGGDQSEAALEQLPRSPHHPSPGRLVEAAGEALGVSRARILGTLARGGTLADLAEESGSTGEELAAKLLARLTEWVDEAVANERIGEARAAEILATAPERIDWFVNNPHRRAAHRALGARLLQRAAGVIGVTPEDLRDRLAGGAILEEVAEENGVAAEELVDLLMSPIIERLERAVAAGRITEQAAQAKLAELTRRITERVGHQFTRG